MTRIGDAENVRNMRAAAEAIAERAPGLKKPTLKRYPWSRLHSDLLDDIRWPLVARRAQVPLPIVEALVMRLEVHANRSQPRGYVGDFNAEAMAVRWGVDVDTVLRTFAELERDDIGWIDQDHIVSFWARNPDSDQDPTAAERQHRKREHDRTLRASILAGTGVSPALIAARSRPLSPAERKRRQRQRERAERQQDVTNASRNGVTGHASRDASVTEKRPQKQELGMSHRDSVTSRPEQSRKERNVTSPAAGLAPVYPVVFADKAKALQWLRDEGEVILMRRCQVLRSKAGRMIQRWSLTLGDITALAEIILATSATAAQGASFERMVVDQVARRTVEKLGPALPLPPVAIKGG